MSDEKVLRLSEAELRTVQVGNAGGFVLAHVRPLLDASRRGALDRLKGMQRRGTWDSSQAQSEVAAICALDELEARLVQQVNMKEGLVERLEAEEATSNE